MNYRRCLQFRLPTLLVAVAVLCVLLVANTRPSAPVMLGHVSSDDPQIRPGLWIMGSEFGWPWTHRLKSDDHLPELIRSVFNEFHRNALVANVAVGLLMVTSSMMTTELALWGIRRWRRKERLGGSPSWDA